MREVWAVCGADDCFGFCSSKAYEQEGLVSEGGMMGRKVEG
jgi:hypothetical protein